MSSSPRFLLLLAVILGLLGVLGPSPTIASVGKPRLTVSLVADLYPGKTSSCPSNLTASRGELFFTTRGPQFSAHPVLRLYETDGTRAGTRLLWSHPGSQARSLPLTDVAATSLFVYFASQTKGEIDLWAYNRQARAVVHLRTFRQRPKHLPVEIDGLQPVAENLLFNGPGGDEWVSNGTAGGTHPLPGFPRVDPWSFVRFRGATYFLAIVKRGDTLWRLTSSLPTAKYITNLGPLAGPGAGEGLVRMGSRMFYILDSGNHRAIGATNGTAQGTHVIRPIGVIAGPMPWDDLVATRRAVFFIGYDSAHGYEVWTSKGTAKGTRMVKDVHRGPLGYPMDLRAAGNKVYFNDHDGSHHFFFVTNGRARGTHWIHGRFEDYSTYNKTLFMGRLALSASTKAHGDELWVTNGSRSATDRPRDIYPGRGSSNPNDLTRVGKRLFFQAFNPRYGGELWMLQRAVTGGVPRSSLHSGRSSNTDDPCNTGWVRP